MSNTQQNIWIETTAPGYVTHPSAFEYLRSVVMPRVWEKLRPPVRLLPSEWADKNRYIMYGSTQGKWQTSFVPYIKEPMDRIIESQVEEESIIAPNQSAKSEMGLCIVGYYMEHRPTDIIIFQPDASLAKKFAMDKVDPLIEGTPSLSAIVGELKSKDKKTKMLEKRYNGKHLFIVGANSRAAFRQTWGEVIMKDDFDAFPAYIKSEGDPGKLADARAESYPHSKKIINISTPTDDGSSRIQQKFEASSQAHWFIKCPSCGMEQVLLFSHFSVFNYLPHGKLVYDMDNGENPRWTYYECGNEKCKYKIEEWMKPALVAKGRYIHRYPERTKHLGYQWNRLVSPFSTWTQIAAEFISSVKDVQQLRVTVNLTFAEWFEQRKSQRINPDGFIQRLNADYDAKVYVEVPKSKRVGRVNHKYAVPMPGFIIVISIDVQDDRLEAIVKAWGLDEESFLVKRVILRGSPGRSDVWSRLDDLVDEEFYHASGVYLKARVVTIDIQGHFTNNVYAWIKRKRQTGRNVFGVQGKANTTTVRMIVDKVSNHNTFNVPVIICGVDTAKEVVRQRIVDYDQTKAQLHFCDDVGSDDPNAVTEYFKGLVAEDRIDIMDKRTGRYRSEWRKRKGQKSNEPQDLENYNLAGLYVLNLHTNMKAEFKKFQDRLTELSRRPDSGTERDNKKFKKELKRRSNFVTGDNE